jgi:hypothetical protein
MSDINYYPILLNENDEMKHDIFYYSLDKDHNKTYYIYCSCGYLFKNNNNSAPAVIRRRYNSHLESRRHIQNIDDMLSFLMYKV